MNKKIFWIPAIMLIISLFTSCKESEAPGKYDDWEERNEVFMDSLENVYRTQAANLPVKDSLYRFQDPFAQQANVYYKKLNPEVANDFGRRPFYTETVNVYYQGYLIDGERFDGNFYGDNPTHFDSPMGVDINGNWTTGFSWALQHMRLGERCMFYIPYQSGYGTSATGSIPGYSTLIFDIILAEIVE